MLVLSDLGERRILREIIPLYATAAGDDCAIISNTARHVVVTTDPVPVPAADLLGGDKNLYWMGWLLVTINASDIAASGARPSSFVAALEMPSSLPVAELEQLLSGIRDSCVANGLDYVGGNLREASRIGGVGTALGFSNKIPLRRTGARIGDHLVVIGHPGKFWGDVERVLRGDIIEKGSSPLFAPISQAKHVWKAHEAGLLSCGMDTSDGLAPALSEISQVNQLGLQIDLNVMTNDYGSGVARPERLWMGWGDWTVIAAVRPQHVDELRELLHNEGAQSAFVGRFCGGLPAVYLNKDTHTMPLGRLESERFSSDSWFSAGIQKYLEMVREFPLP